MKITNYRYMTPLWLFRGIEKVRTAEGSDALYVVGREFYIQFMVKRGVVEEVRVPQGLLTDLTSVPRLFRSIVGRVGPHLEAAIVHDFMYGRNTPDFSGFLFWTRKQADQLFLVGMEKAGVVWSKTHYVTLNNSRIALSSFAFLSSINP